MMIQRRKLESFDSPLLRVSGDIGGHAIGVSVVEVFGSDVLSVIDIWSPLNVDTSARIVFFGQLF
jgi:hypothetical protein